MSKKAEQFLDTLKQAVEDDQLMLPTLPEVALKIRETVEGEDASAQQVADVVVQDASLSARLIQVANSPIYHGAHKVDNIQSAVTRLGLNMVRDMVIRLAMKQMFQATSDALDKHFHHSWNTAVEVAAISRMLATGVAGVNPEQALLAGLIHNIGSLPILVLAENDDELFYDEEALGQLIDELQSPVGELIVKHWCFADNMIEVVTNVDNFHYTHDGAANLVDIVQVALLQGRYIADYDENNWQDVPAFAQLGMDTEVNVVEMEENKEQIEQTRQTLQV